MSSLRVLLVDDHEFVRKGIRDLISCRPNWNVCGEAADGIDAIVWEKIVLNLLSNAFKFTFEGTVTVRLTTDASGNQAKLTVSDTGTGIPEHELPRIFERFHRIEGAQGRKGGQSPSHD